MIIPIICLGDTLEIVVWLFWGTVSIHGFNIADKEFTKGSPEIAATFLSYVVHMHHFYILWLNLQ